MVVSCWLFLNDLCYDARIQEYQVSLIFHALHIVGLITVCSQYNQARSTVHRQNVSGRKFSAQNRTIRRVTVQTVDSLLSTRNVLLR